MATRTFADLTVHVLGGVDGSGGGDGPAVVLLHGYGAPGTDLLGLARELQLPPGTRLLFPEAPLTIHPLHDGRAWFPLNLEELIPRLQAGDVDALSTIDPPGLVEARQQLTAALDAAQAVLSIAPERLVLGGFSQGSWMACDQVLATSRSVAGLVILSGMVVARDTWAPGRVARGQLPVLQTHGRRDEILPFRAGEALRDFLAEEGPTPDFVPFAGGHGIGGPASAALQRFLNAVLT